MRDVSFEKSFEDRCKINCPKNFLNTVLKNLIMMLMLLGICVVPLFAKEEKNTVPEKKQKEPVTVKIEKAQRTEYNKDTVTGAVIIKLEGDVQLSVSNSNSKTVINAELINFDRDRQMLYAEGNVVLSKMDGNKLGETLNATSVLFNVETQEGVFDGGRVVQEQTDAINLPSGSTLIVASDMFGRDDSGTIAFKNGALTFCEDPEPHWKIRASRIWLLPGNEFAFFNALLYIGKIPVLYLPFFYYPKDEMIFNPAFGYDSRKGYYMQNTYYIIGRKGLNKSSSEDSIFDFMKTTSLKKQVRDGLFMHNLEENDTESDKYLKVMADWYTSLGGMAGVQGKLNPNKYITNLEFSGAIGFSRSLKYISTSSGTSYVPYFDSEMLWDNSYIFGKKIPFRYELDFKMNFSHTLGNLELSLPLYSDAFFHSDFISERSESMDWINYLMNLSNQSEDTSNSSETSSYTWALNGSFKPPVQKLNPFISSLSLSGISSSMTFYTKNMTPDAFKKLYPDASSSKISFMHGDSPARKFYYPQQIVPFKANLNMSGTIVSYPKSAKTTSKTDARTKINFDIPEELMTEKQKEEKLKKEQELAKKIEEENQNTQTPDAEKQTETEAAEAIAAELAQDDSLQKEENTASAFPVPDSLFPEISVPAPSVKASSATNQQLRYSLTYSLATEFASLVSYDADKVSSSADIDLQNFISTFYSVKVPVDLKSSLSFGSGKFSLANNLKFTAYTQKHPTLKEDENGNVGTSSKKTIVTNDYSAQKLELNNSNSLSYKPFSSGMFSDTSVSWNASLKLLRTKFDSANFDYTQDNPSWNYEKIDFTDDTWSSHNLSATFGVNEKTNYSQKFSLQANLPPLNQSYAGQFSATFPYFTFNARTTLKSTKVTSGSEEKDYWKWEPFVQSSSLKLFKSKLSLNQSFTYTNENEEESAFVKSWFSDDEKTHPTAFTIGLSYSTLSLNYSHQYTYGYDLLEESGWTIREKKEFLPYSVSLSYSIPTKTLRLWKNRLTLTPSMSTSLSADLIRPTNSYFSISPTLKFSIYKFLDISFSATSRNDVIFRYIQDWFDYNKKVPGEENVFIDLWDSFSFWDTDARKRSGFKLKSLSLTCEHNLHDWDLSMNLSISPKLITSTQPYKYNFDPSFTLKVLWRPMSSLKASIVHQYDETKDATVWKLNTED